MNLKAENTIEDFEQGPIIDNNILNWLLSESKGRLLLLPLYIEFDESGSRIQSSYLFAGETKIKVQLVDVSSSRRLVKNIRTYYPKANQCRVWMKARWRSSSSKELPEFNIPAGAVLGIAEQDEMHIRI